MQSLPRHWSLLVLLVAAPAFSASPVLPIYDWGNGTLQFKAVNGDEGHQQGFLQGGECPIDGPAIDAVWQGDLLVGTVQLCQQGPGCKDHGFPLFAFYVHHDGSLVADVVLDKGCKSAALKDNHRLLLTTHLSQPGESSGKDSRRRHAGPNAPPALTGHLAKGQQALALGDGKTALSEFNKALKANEDIAAGWLGVGLSEILLNRKGYAVSAYQRSLAAREDKLTYYNLACVQVKLNRPAEALDSLQKAIDHGFNDASALSRDPELLPLKTDPRFQAILESILARQSAHSNR